ncbi:hypothetical protein LSH36_825g03027 [Paralvinella palmiformis]|uniref:Uncharacterized protein n=1 Tax=Paralvinella palmiformis TaxID=53620 RepID=A0AAD9IZ39_9ANNE|nr:hypothetical protein LSH36_825g03027 [Paralvinella palmiformis]
MPSNKHFTLSILIGGTVVPEYTKNDIHYVECNLSTPVSYKLPEADVIAGEIEKQEWPVTPYSLKIETHNLDETCYFRVLIDGVKVKAVSLGPNSVSTIRGFRDDTVIREFLFSMPRFAKDSADRLESGRETNVGCIEVECWEAELKSSSWKSRHKMLNFQQANKKDVYKVTSGEYTMVTSKVGKPVSRRSVLRKVDSWRRKELLSSLKIHYRMGHTLQEMGFTLKPCLIPEPTVASGQSTQNVNVKQEVQGNSSTQTGDVIKIDDDVAAAAAQCVIDLTADSDEDMNVVEGDRCGVPISDATERVEEEMQLDDSGGRAVSDEEQSVVTTMHEKGSADPVTSDITDDSNVFKEQSVDDSVPVQQRKTTADVISHSLSETEQNEMAVEQTAKSDEAETLRGQTEKGSRIESTTSADNDMASSPEHRNNSGICLGNVGDDVTFMKVGEGETADNQEMSKDPLQDETGSATENEK